MTLFPEDPRSYVRSEFEARNKRNPAYSWRSFARDLSLSPSMLSEFLKGRYGFSRSKAEHVARHIRLDSAHTEHFIDLLEAGFHRFESQRKLASLRASNRLQNSKTWIGQHTIERMLDWTYFALLEIVGLEKGQARAEGWLKPFRPTDERSHAAIDGLCELNLLTREENELKVAEDVSVAGEQLGEQDLRRFHTEVLGLGQQALDGLTLEEREMVSVFASIREEDFAEMRKELNDTFLQVLNKYSARPGPDSVHCFSFQAFPIYRRD